MKNFFVIETGGIYTLNRMNIFSYPQIRLIRDLELKAEDGNPLCFSNKNGARLWYRRMFFVGEELIHTPYFRTSYTEQWVGNDQLKQLLHKRYGHDFHEQFKFERLNLKND